MVRTLPGGRAAEDRQHLAHRRAAVADARVERAQVELEAAALALVDRGHVRVEAPALAVDLDDVALGDALRRESRGGGAPRRRRGKEAGLLHRARDANGRPGRPRRPRPTRAGAARRSPPGRCGRAAASFPAPSARPRAPRAVPAASPATRTRGRTALRRARTA